MTRTLSVLLFGMIAGGLFGCGGGGASSAALASPAAGPGGGGCVTPEGGSADAPPTCAPGCTWNPEVKACEEGERGIIIEEKTKR
jgi:hypothetical protein